MADRIDSVHNKITPRPARDSSGARESIGVRQGGRDGTTADAAATAPRESVVLTGQGQRLGELERTLAELPAVDKSRVEAVKADIAGGNYRVDVENIADMLLRTETEFDG